MSKEEASSGSSSSVYDADYDVKISSLRQEGRISQLQAEMMQACAEGDERKVARLIEDGADPHQDDSHQGIRPAVYIATRNGHLGLLKYLVEHHGGDVSHMTTRRTTLLHLAARRGHVDVARWLAKEKGLNPRACNKHGGTPLHTACEAGHLVIVKFLVEEMFCDAQYIHGDLPESPLHTACIAGRIDVLRYLLESQHCDSNHKTKNGETLLHLAAQRGHRELVEYLIVEQQLDPNERTDRQYTPLHLAAQSNKPEIVRYLVTLPQCDVDSRSKKNGYSPLHVASKYGRLEVVRTLLSGKDARSDPNLRADDGCTPLHLACKHGHKEVVRFLLKEKKINPSLPGPMGQSPIQVTEKQDIIKTLIHYGANAQESLIDLFPNFSTTQLEDIVRIMVIGDPSTGKSTLVEALKTLPVTGIKKHFINPKVVKSVTPCTPGIVPHELSGSEFGRVLLFDFAGHSEYYTSHAVVIESAVSTTAPVFLVVVDLSRGFQDIKKRIFYWISFIENVRPSLNSRPYLIIVGSHLDVLSKQQDYRHQLHLIEESVDHILSSSSLNYVGFYSLNCTTPATQGRLRECLKRSCDALRTNSEDDSICHAFYAFLCDEFEGKIMVTLKEVATAIQSSNQPFPFTPQHLCELSERATNIANIMLFKNSYTVEESSIVLEVKTLLAKIQAVLFAPQEFLSIENSLSVDTGIISYTELARTFPDFDDERLKVIIQFMERLEIGQRISDKETLQLIMRGNPPPEAARMAQSMSEGPKDALQDGRHGYEQFLFLPPLIDEHRPIAIWRSNPSFTYYTGWCLQCSLDIQQFPPRFLHAVLLRLAFSFAVANEDPLQVRHGIGRECTLWKSGIHWLDLNGIETIVEVVEEGQVIVMAMRCIENQELQCVKLRTAVIKTILETKQLYASQIATDEFLVSPDCLNNYPLHGIRRNSTILYSVNMLAHSLIKGYPCVKCVKAEEMTRINGLIYWDPYIGLGEALLKELFDHDAQDAPLSNEFLFKFAQKQADSWFYLGYHLFHLDRATLEIIKARSEGREDRMCMHVLETFCQRDVAMTVRSLRAELDKFSIFCGRNILVSLQCSLLCA